MALRYCNTLSHSSETEGGGARSRGDGSERWAGGLGGIGGVEVGDTGSKEV